MKTPDDIKSQVRKVKGWFTDEQMDALYPFLQALPPWALIVEIGTYKGRSTLFFARTRPDAFVLTVDKGEEFPVTAAGARAAGSLLGSAVLQSGRVFQVIGESVEVAARFNWPIDFLFIDGDHTHEGVKADIEAWARYVQPEGYVAFHDYGNPEWPGVRAAVDEWLAESPTFAAEMRHARLLVAQREE